MADTGFGSRLATVVADRGPLCVGIDPHAGLLDTWGLADTASGLREFGLRVVEAAIGRVGIVKPQVAFFERHGSAGYAALEQVLAAARGAGLLVIADVKRGDIGSSVDAYGAAWLTPGSPLEADALTTVAYQGVGSLDGVLARAHEAGKGVFVLAATSNPEGAVVQQARRSDGSTVAGGVIRDLTARRPNSNGLSPFGIVLGATVDPADFDIDLQDLSTTPILAPGFGHQGARLSDIAELFGPAAAAVIPNVSRSVLGAGPDGIAAAITMSVQEVASA